MKLILTSDLHYGFDHNTSNIHEKFFAVLGDNDALAEMDRIAGGEK